MSKSKASLEAELEPEGDDEVDPDPDLQQVNVRLPRAAVRQLKRLAAANGQKYLPYVAEVLMAEIGRNRDLLEEAIEKARREAAQKVELEAAADEALLRTLSTK